MKQASTSSICQLSKPPTPPGLVVKPPVESVERAVARVLALFDLPPPELVAEPLATPEALAAPEDALLRSAG